MTRGAGNVRIIVLGYIVRGPLGGLAWHHLQYVVGLARMGADVLFVEDSDDYPGCYDPDRHVVDTDPTYGLAFAQRCFDRLGLGDRWAYFDAHGRGWVGPAGHYAAQRCRTADIVLNVSGVNPLRPWTATIPARVFIDTDPVFTQLRHLEDPAALDAAAAHTNFFSFGTNIGEEECTVPDDGLPWQPTRQPVVMSVWPTTERPRTGSYTTVMQWESYPARHRGDLRFGSKSDSFGPYLDFPREAGVSMQLALGTADAPRARLREGGWDIIDPLVVTRDPWRFQQYVHTSRAEFSVAKQAYVATRSGWFSERSTAYLASSRPVVVQDTGFTRWLPSQPGVLAFTSPSEALEAIACVEADYDQHCRAAREIAYDYFDAQAVLGSVLDRLGSETSTTSRPPTDTTDLGPRARESARRADA